jgi:hypothetical protein
MSVFFLLLWSLCACIFLAPAIIGISTVCFVTLAFAMGALRDRWKCRNMFFADLEVIYKYFVIQSKNSSAYEGDGQDKGDKTDDQVFRKLASFSPNVREKEMILSIARDSLKQAQISHVNTLLGPQLQWKCILPEGFSAQSTSTDDMIFQLNKGTIGFQRWENAVNTIRLDISGSLSGPCYSFAQLLLQWKFKCQESKCVKQMKSKMQQNTSPTDEENTSTDGADSLSESNHSQSVTMNEVNVDMSQQLQQQEAEEGQKKKFKIASGASSCE